MVTNNKDMTPILLVYLGNIYPTKNSKKKARYGLYQCQYCGKEFKTISNDIKNKHTKSCGCLRALLRKEKGLTKHKLHMVWKSMKDRCYNPNNRKYKDYGGRGIGVCNKWRWDYINFYTWSINNNYMEGLSLDRVYVNGNYEPNNCRYTTALIQSQNVRPINKANKSGYKGVSWSKQHNKFEVRIRYLNKKLHLGLFEDPIEGAKAYQIFVLKNNTEHTYVNVLTEEEIKNCKNYK